MKRMIPVLCVYDYLGERDGDAAWHRDSVMIEVESIDDVEDEFERRMTEMRTRHSQYSVGPKPEHWSLRSVLTPRHVMGTVH